MLGFLLSLIGMLFLVHLLKIKPMIQKYFLNCLIKKTNKKKKKKNVIVCIKNLNFFKITENKGKIILNIDDPFCEGNSRKGDFIS